MLLLAIYCLSGALFCAVWYALALRRTRRKASQILRWIEASLANNGYVVGMRWMATSRFRVPLRLAGGVFHRAWMLVDLVPCDMPLRWLLSKIKKQRDVITFQADLDVPPTFSMGVHNLRWFARSGRKTPLECANWTFESAGSFVMSTRMDWQKEVTSAMASLADPTNREFLHISFQRQSPHFSATLPLETIAPESPVGPAMFEAMRDLAASSSSASLF